ncbi:MAG: helix-turn-helix transcriptional regulator [Bacteroidetes bacterium]|nr:helix-turn-helix transcriptional regulator [Bacteroidota bacterium]
MKASKKPTLSEKIRSIRATRGFSQEYIAKNLHITQQSYSLCERMPEKMTVDRMRKVCAILNVKLCVLLYDYQ